MKRNLLTIVIGAVLVVIFALLLFVFQVRQSEVAVVTTFGKPTAQPITEPGAYFKWPWPIQKVYKFDQRIQNFEDKFSENLTADNNNLLTSVYVGWRISDAADVFPDVSRRFRRSCRRAEQARRHVAQRQKRRRRQTSAVRFRERGPAGIEIRRDRK